MRVMLFTMVLLQHAFIARASLFTDFCPTIDAISVPDEANQWDADGFPQFFTIDLSNWKGNTKRRRQKTRQRMTRRMMVLRGVDVLVGRKGGGSVGTWKPSSTQST